MKKLIIFGFEGTIVDTSPGILFCFNATALSMGYAPIPHESLYGIIGIPLDQGFRRLYGMKEDEIEYAVNNYSKLYSMKGEEMLMVYSGVQECLESLKENGCKLAIATQQHRKYISNMLETYKEIGDLFDVVCATDVDTNLNKRDMILQACNTLGIPGEDALVVGDSYLEAEGARDAGVDFAAALYGWGFRSQEDAQRYHCRAYLNSASEIQTKLTVL